MIEFCTLLAQTTSTAPSTGAPTGPGGVGSLLGSPLVPLILVMVVFWFVMSRGRNKEKQRFQQMLDSLKKNDRVQTIGGMLGTVVDVRDDEVVVKVDEANNVKIRFNRSAIKDVLREAPTTETKP